MNNFQFYKNKEETKTTKITNIFNLKRGSSPRPINNFMSKTNIGINWLKIGDTKKVNKYINNTSEKIIEEGRKKTKIVNKGDMIISNSMSFGKPYIIDMEECAVHDGWSILEFKNKNEPIMFWYYMLSSEFFQKELKLLAQGGVVKNISNEILNQANINNFDTITEKTNISLFLQQLDDNLEQLKLQKQSFEQKRKYFQQELLSGRLRIKLNDNSIKECLNLGYIELKNIIVDEKSFEVYEIIESKKKVFNNWLEVDFDKKVEFYKNSDNNWKNKKVNGRMVDIPFDWFSSKIGKEIKISSENFSNDDIKSKNRKYYATKEVERNLLLNYEVVGSTNIISRAKKKIIDESTWIARMKKTNKEIYFKNGSDDIVFSTGMVGFVSDKINMKYVHYITKTDSFNRLKDLYCDGTTQESINDKNLKLLSLVLPKTYLEQTLISEHLTNMDNLIEDLETKIQLEEKRFQYFKQELLSGRLRIK